ncbi:MAG: polysaccharide deacetylase family protein [Thermodesulfobacteriota bacterium]
MTQSQVGIISRRILTTMVLLFLVVGAAVAAPAYAVPSHAVIFMYHRFGEERYPATNIRLNQFEAHLNHLDEGGYRVWPLKRIVTHLREGRTIPDRTVAITIDDAFKSVYTRAYPLLKAHGFPFTVFVATNPIDQLFPSMMTWGQMREMKKGGADFANHGTSHGHLAQPDKGESRKAWRERIKGEISTAERRLEAELGSAPKLFAYPYGEYDLRLAKIVEELGYAGFGQHSGPVGSHSDLRAAPRFPMAEAYAALRKFSMKAATLPLPVVTEEPWNPLLTGRSRPLLHLTLEKGEGDVNLRQLTCYVSGQGRGEIVWVDRDEKIFTVQATAPLGKGRSRYNCTAPSNSSGRYYWYSHPWLLTAAP